MAWLHQEFNGFALGVALIFWGAVLLGLIRLFWTEPRQTGAKLCGIAAWFLALLAILWTAHLADKYL
jgi:hypothetical protein